MSHLTRLNVKCRDSAIVEVVVSRMGYTISTDTFVNVYHANERVENARIIKNKKGELICALDIDGTPVIENIMTQGRHKAFLQAYSTEAITKTAIMDGAQVINRGLDNQGNVILQVMYH